VRRAVFGMNQGFPVAGREDRAVGKRGIDDFLRGRIVLPMSAILERGSTQLDTYV